MAEYKNIRTLYDCERMGSEVTIETKLLIHRSARSVEIDKESPVQYSCDHCDDCGVGTKKGISTTYDWKKCVHPDLKQ